MAQFKRTLSVLLAVLMVFTTMSISFTVISSAAVDRVPSENPKVKLTVPQYLQSHGNNPSDRGKKIDGGGKVFLQVPGGAESLNVSCSTSGISLDGPVIGTDTYTWTVQDGTLENTPTASSTLKWTVTYKSKADGQVYTTYAWSAIKLAYNDPGLASNTLNNNTWAWHKTQNQHVEVIEPVNGNAISDPDGDSGDYTLCYVDIGSANFSTETSSPMLTATYWTKQNDKNSSQTWTSDATPNGEMYVDISQITDLTDTGLQVKASTASYLENDGNHPQWYEGATLVSQTIAGNACDNFVLSNNSTGQKAFGESGTSSFSGSLTQNVSAGQNIVLQSSVKWEGNVTGSVQSALHTVQDYTVTIHTYDKSALKSALEDVTAKNYQESQMYASKPSSIVDTQNKFRTWSQYMTALENAWAIYGRENVSQTEINSAATNLRACIATYSGTNNRTWVSGMAFKPADYTQTDALIATIPADFYYTYDDNDHTNGVYYKYSAASTLIAALADIASDRDILDTRYQNVVNEMKANLNTAINNLKTTGYKAASVHFIGNGTNVSKVPSDTQAKLFGRAFAPADVPERTYFSFTGWYYDAEQTQPVSWPITINPSSDYFIGDLNAKSDSVGVAVNVYAGWNQTGKTLNFDSQDGSPIEPVMGVQGGKFTPTEAQIPTKPGYVFDCWCTDNTLQTEVNWATFTFGKYDTVYARYNRAEIYVTFDSNDGIFPNGGSTMSVKGLYGDRVIVPAIPSKTNYAFMGWGFTANTAPAQAQNLDSYTFPSSNQKVYAIWSNAYRNYTVDYNDGSEPTVFTAQLNSDIEQPADPPARAGYDFSNQWTLDAAGDQIISFPYRLNGDNVTFYAKWIPHKVNIDFSANGGTMASSFNASAYTDLNVGDVLNFPAEPTKEGFVFVGWGLTANAAENEAITFTTVPAQYTMLYAIWKVEPYTAKYRLASDASGTLKQGQIVNLTVYMSANFIVSSNSFIVYYDNRYFVPAVNGQAYSQETIGSAACTKDLNGNAYFKVVQNAGGNVTDCNISQTGRVNVSSKGVRQYYPESWLASTTALKTEYSMYDYVYFAVLDSTDGTRMQPTTEQAIATFQLKVKDNADLADGNSDFASIFMLPDFNRTAVASGKLMACRETQLAWDAAANYDCEYRVFSPEYRFAVQEQETIQVSFVTKGGNNMTPVRAPIGQTYTPAEPKKSYYVFTGWSFEDSESAETFKSFVVPNDNVILYAHWTGAPANYTVVHHIQNLNGGFDIQSETLQAPVGTTVYATPRAMDGFNEPDPDYGEVVGDPSSALELNLWYYRKQTKVTLNANGGYFANDRTKTTVALPQGYYGAALTNSAGTPSRDGYDFKEWTYNGSAYTFATYPANDITVYASWTVKSYTIHFYLNNSLYATITKNYGAAITAPTVSVPDGQAFSGWKSASGQRFNYTTMPADPITEFYGTLRSSGVQLTVAIRSEVNGKFVVTESFVAVDAPAGTTVTEDMLGYTKPDGYKDIVWRNGETADSSVVLFPLTLSNDMTIYGTLNPKDVTITMMYSVLGDDYELYANVRGVYGKSYTREPDPEFPPDEFGFMGWYTDEELTQLYTWPDTMPADNITVYGKLYILEGTVTFDANGGMGNVPEDMSAEVGNSIVLPGAGSLKKQYYRFGGWALSAGSTTPVTSIDIYDASTITVYAIWIVNYATLNFDLNGADSGTKPNSQRVELNESFTAFPAGADLVKDGFLFIGWATTRDAKEALTSYTATTTGSKTFFAVWAALSVEIVAASGSTAVIDDENHIIYGLYTKPDASILNASFLNVVGNGHLNYKTDDGIIGTGTQVELINDYSDTVDATYSIVIIGDLNSDGEINSTDMTTMKALVVGASEFDMYSPEFFAADLNGDNAINSSDLTIMKSLVNGSSEINQGTRDLTVI